MELLDRHSEGVIALTGCLQSRFCRRLVEERPGRRPRPPRRPGRRSSAPRTSTSRSRRTGSPSRTKANEGIVRYARELGRPLVATADVHYLRREDYSQPRGAALRADQVDARAAEADASTPTSSSSRARRRWRSRSPRWPEAVPTTLEIAERCERRDRARQAAAAALPDPGRRGAARRCCAGSPREGLRRRYGDPPPAEARRAARVRARGDRRDGLRVLLPDRLGLRQVREGERDRGRPGPRLGGRLDRRLRAQHHRPRPARQRAALRALPQPGAQVDAGHRHRLLGPRPRAGDPLRRRRSTGASRWRRSSPSARWRRARRPATRPGCSASTTRPATGSRS